MDHLLAFSMIFLYLQKGLSIEETCGDTRHVESNVGGEVMLPVQQTEIQDITWMSSRDKNIFAVTEPGKPVVIRSMFYNGRINVTDNGTLIITKLTREDQGIYKGSVLRRISGQCAQFYNLTVYEEQVFSSSPSTTSPIRISTEAMTTKSSKQVTVWITIILSVSATLALLLIFIVTIILSRSQTGTSHIEDGILYTELDKNKLQKGFTVRRVQEQTTVTYSNVKVTLQTTNNV
ncbi:uncharacterized protein LOC122922222 isoform X1 [Bufo gargarizans]|uniref:uncharacterized protein LOC122922222 isoform X1 n=1 Tax=Bufo gargarizans TaxID=30331 RepID=UPI001CF32F6A|nr:uncharacterized protein LOC122922222 isoform X1 [Bufo gargarizans]